MSSLDSSIWIKRANEEERAAERAKSPAAARIHRGIAAAYRVRAKAEVRVVDELDRQSAV